jgi:exportin-7
VIYLGGNYVNFGVFKLYNDQSLDQALEVAMQLVLSIPGDDLMVRIVSRFISLLVF